MPRTTFSILPAVIEAEELTGASLLDMTLDLPKINGNVTVWMDVVKAGQLVYSEAYPYVYYTSVAFGAVVIVASCFLGDVGRYKAHDPHPLPLHPVHLY